MRLHALRDQAVRLGGLQLPNAADVLLDAEELGVALLGAAQRQHRLAQALQLLELGDGRPVLVQDPQVGQDVELGLELVPDLRQGHRLPSGRDHAVALGVHRELAGVFEEHRQRLPHHLGGLLARAGPSDVHQHAVTGLDEAQTTPRRAVARREVGVTAGVLLVVGDQLSLGHTDALAHALQREPEVLDADAVGVLVAQAVGLARSLGVVAVLLEEGVDLGVAGGGHVAGVALGVDADQRDADLRALIEEEALHQRARVPGLALRLFEQREGQADHPLLGEAHRGAQVAQAVLEGHVGQARDQLTVVLEDDPVPDRLPDKGWIDLHGAGDLGDVAPRGLPHLLPGPGDLADDLLDLIVARVQAHPLGLVEPKLPDERVLGQGGGEERVELAHHVHLRTRGEAVAQGELLARHPAHGRLLRVGPQRVERGLKQEGHHEQTGPERQDPHLVLAQPGEHIQGLHRERPASIPPPLNPVPGAEAPGL